MSPADLFNPAHQEVFALHYDESGQQAPAAILQGQALTGFRRTRAGQPGPKLYVVRNADGVQYVGYTRTSFAQRLRLGHARRQAHAGYHGYKWLTRPGLKLHIFPLSGTTLQALADAVDDISPQQLAECIESELVYCIRHHSGQWPLGQHEIHFHAFPHYPALRQLAVEVAQSLFQQLQPLPPTP